LTDDPRIQHGLERQARENGDRTCLIEGESSLTFAEADADAERFARFLRERGVVPGDRIALLLGNSRRYVAAFHGVLKAGAVAVPLNPVWPQGWRVIADRCSPALLITEERLLASASALLDHLPCEIPDLATFDPDPRPDGRKADDPAVVLYTSGSTGAPKGVVLTHRNVVANTLGVLDYLPLTSEDLGLAVLPFHYVYGQSVLQTHLWAGAALAIENRTAYPQVLLREIERLGVTGLSGVPSTFMLLLQKGDFEGFAAPRLRYLTCAGGHLPGIYVRRLRNRLPHAKLFLMYGATEAAGRISYLPPDQLERKWGSIGVPIRGVDMRVMAGGGPVPPNQEGEIEARGETFSPGYWPLTDPEDRLPEDGWYRTGDLGRQDEDGYFFLTGRRTDLIKIAGHRVSGAEIERALYDTHLVQECAVIGRPDEVLGERAEAWVVPVRPNVGAEEILERLARQLPPFKRPSQLHLCDALPKSASGKILKNALH
jgi:acyl-CoA synthetase (AMP-forming)/AMP-acid ligase II